MSPPRELVGERRSAISTERRRGGGRLAHRERLLRVGDGALGVLARQREVRDLIGGLDEAAQERGALDDRGVRLGVRNGGHVLHEADEELRAADLIELAASRELRLPRLNAERLATLGDTLHRAEDEPMLLA